jgi:heme/copper-type cytochrome/quinol oxidase subunit 4
MHCFSRVRLLESHIGGQKNGSFNRNRNSTASLYARELMNNSVIKWILVAIYFVLAFWFGLSYECQSDSARPLILSLSITPLVLININFFLHLPMNLLHLPEVSDVSNYSLRRKLVLITWLLFLVVILWGAVGELGCSV